MSIGEFLNCGTQFFLAEEQAHAQVKSTDKTWFYSETFDLCKWAFLFLENAVKTALNLCSWLFETKRVNEH